MNNQTITVHASYIRLVYEAREAQKAYFEANQEAKRTRQGIAWQRAKDLLREAKNIEHQLDEATEKLMNELCGTMSADQAILAMRLQTDEDLEQVRKGG